MLETVYEETLKSEKIDNTYELLKYLCTYLSDEELEEAVNLIKNVIKENENEQITSI